MTGLRRGLAAPCFAADPAEIIGLGLAAEQGGFDGFFLWDHLVHDDRGDGPPVLDPWPLLAVLASQTTRIRLGTLQVGSGTAHVIKGDLDAAAGHVGAVFTLEPPFRISTITGYLAGMDSLLRQRRFARSAQAQELREQIRVFTAAASPAAAPEEDH